MFLQLSKDCCGPVNEVIFDLQPAHHEAEKALHEHEAMQAVGQGASG